MQINNAESVKISMKSNKIFAITCMFLFLIVAASCSKGDVVETTDNSKDNMTNIIANDSVCPWENGGKEPCEYTLEEFEALSETQKEMFISWFGDKETFEAWKATAESEIENGGVSLESDKNPHEYTWTEFEALSNEQQELFFEKFETPEDFSEWMNIAQFEETYGKLPWKNGGKEPREYTLEEFEALSDAQKEMFFEWFETSEAFDAWMSKVQPETAKADMSWDDGDKKPSEYSFKEYEALSDTQKEMFFEWFTTPEAFDEWRNLAQFEAEYGKLPWLYGGKQPSEYSFKEYEDLNDAQKEMFFEWFETSDAFDKWMNIAQFENTYGDIPWLHGGKQPTEYTMSEFEALSDAQKEMFFEWFETSEAFEQWLNSSI